MNEGSVPEPGGTVADTVDDTVDDTVVDPGDESTGDAWLDDVLDRSEQLARDLAGVDLTSLVRLDRPSTGLHNAAARVERIRRTFQGFDTAYVTALEAGDEARRHGCPSTAVFLRVQLRLSPGEAKARVKAARACSPRSEFAAGTLPAARPVLAAARAAGALSSDHASVILDALDRIPETVAPAEIEAAEERLVAEAAMFDPGGVARLGRRILDHIDPDGTLRDDSWKQRTRAATLFRNPDGTGTLRARLTPEAFETWQTVLDPLSRPLPTGPDGPDPRSPEQRVHDGLYDAGVRLLSSGDLPASGGTPTTIVIHMTQEQYAAQVSADAPELRCPRMPSAVLEPSALLEPPAATQLSRGIQRAAVSASQASGRRSGLVETEHGTQLPLSSAFRMADQAAIYTLLTDSRDVPLQLGRTTRIATPGQTIALAARDRGCTFPNCDRPPAWTQRHHIIAWLVSGATDLANLALVCGYHHRSFEALGWRCVMFDGRPHWIPPAWIDPRRRPMRNTFFDELARP